MGYHKMFEKINFLVVFLICVVIVSFIYMDFRKKQTIGRQKEILYNIDKFEKIIISKDNRNLTLNKDEALKLLEELKKEERPKEYARPADYKVYINIILDNENTLNYSIVPGNKIRGEFWVFTEKNKYYRNKPIRWIYSKWIHNFLEEKGFLE